MARKISVGILGATGAVGQNYVRLLQSHPWFDITYLAASVRNAGKKYGDAIQGKWIMDTEIPEQVKDFLVGDAARVKDAIGKCDFIFSSYQGSKEEIQATELLYASAGIPVISNNSAHRWTEDIPMIIPEVNPTHISLIDTQKKNRGFGKGFVVTKPNCSIQSYLTPIYALMQNGHTAHSILVTTEQAISGAGYPGVPSLDIVDNIIPFISGEDEKTEQEPLKILGLLEDGKITPYTRLAISATCTRVPVREGHLAIVNAAFDTRPDLDEIISIWEAFRSEPQSLHLPSAPAQPIHYLREENRPQPQKDRDADKGMAVSVGRLRSCPIFDYKFVGLSHNTVRGAAGGAILTAELLASKGYL